jgi:transposase
MVAINPEVCDEPVRRFEAFTDDLHAMVRWLKDHAVDVVAMEATGVYWIPTYEVLDAAGFEVHLVNARACKQVAGRKSDVLDCQWIRQLMSYGLLRGAFRPADRWCEVRSYTRQRASLVRDQARSIQHMQKALTQMNLQLANVISDITGKTGMAILRAIIAGERNGAVLAQLRDPRIRASRETIARSLTGTWREEHLFALRQAVARYDFFEVQIHACDQAIQDVLSTLADKTVTDLPTLPAGRSGHRSNAEDKRLRLALIQALGVDLTAIPTIGTDTALVIASELGKDLSRFPDSEHFCSWLTLAPPTRISGGKPVAGHHATPVNRAGEALKMAASNARHSDSFIGAAHRARLHRMDKAVAIKATAHQLARLIYVMLTRGQPYVEKGMDEFEHKRQDQQRRTLERCARAFGLKLVEDPEKTAA